MKRISNTVYWIRYLTISCILDLQENIYDKIKKTYYVSTGLAGRHVVGLGDLSVDIFLEAQGKKCSYIMYLINYIVYGLHLCYKIHILKKCAETLSENILLKPRSEASETSNYLRAAFWLNFAVAIVETSRMCFGKHFCYLGDPGKHLYLSPQILLHVGRRSQPTCSRFS